MEALDNMPYPFIRTNPSIFNKVNMKANQKNSCFGCTLMGLFVIKFNFHPRNFLNKHTLSRTSLLKVSLALLHEKISCVGEVYDVTSTPSPFLASTFEIGDDLGDALAERDLGCPV
jgi:hypothetical protein